MSVVVSTEKIDGRLLEFSFDAASNEFQAWIEDAGHYVKAKTLDECRRKARSLIRRTIIKLSIKAHVVDAYSDEYMDLSWYKRNEVQATEVRPIILRGVDGRSNEPLIEFEDTGRKTKKGRHTFRSDGNGTIVRRLSKAEIDDYKRIRKAKDDAEAAYKEWIAAHEIGNVEEFIKGKVDEKVAELEAADPATGDPRTEPAPAKRSKRR